MGFFSVFSWIFFLLGFYCYQSVYTFEGTSQHYISDVALNSEQFRNIYQPVILSHLSSSCQDRESIRIIRCRIIDNKQLETRVTVVFLNRSKKQIFQRCSCSDLISVLVSVF